MMKRAIFIFSILYTQLTFAELDPYDKALKELTSEITKKGSKVFGGYEIASLASDLSFKYDLSYAQETELSAKSLDFLLKEHTKLLNQSALAKIESLSFNKEVSAHSILFSIGREFLVSEILVGDATSDTLSCSLNMRKENIEDLKIHPSDKFKVLTLERSSWYDVGFSMGRKEGVRFKVAASTKERGLGNIESISCYQWSYLNNGAPTTHPLLDGTLDEGELKRLFDATFNIDY